VRFHPKIEGLLLGQKKLGFPRAFTTNQQSEVDEVKHRTLGGEQRKEPEKWGH